MGVIFICDGCSKQAVGRDTVLNGFRKPDEWYQRSDKDGTQVACSRLCVARIAEKSGKTSVILPI